MRKIELFLYGKHWKLAHILASAVLAGIIVGVLSVFNISITKITSIINNNTIALSASIGGFLFAGMSILISINDNKKLSALKEFGGEKIIFRILISSILCFIISMVLMIADVEILFFDAEKIRKAQEILKYCIEASSLISLLMGFVFLFSSLKIFNLLFK